MIFLKRSECILNAEKMIKEEARGRLTHKWPIAVFSTLELLFVAVVPLLILVLAYSIPEEDVSIIDDFSKTPIKAVLFFIFHLAAVLSFVSLSPVYTGFVRIFSGIAEGKDVDPGDIFYFFYDKERYRNAVRFLTVLIMKCFGLIVMFNIVGLFLTAMSQADSGSEVLLNVGVVFIAIGLIGSFLCMHRYAFSVMLFSYYDYSPENAALFGARAAKGNIGKLIKLTGSFIWLILLTFFVVPFVYVYPFMTCSYFVSVKYILKQFKEQQGKNIADQDFKIDLAMDMNQHAKKAEKTFVQSNFKKTDQINPIMNNDENKNDNTVSSSQADNTTAENSVSETPPASDVIESNPKADDGTVETE